jgi:hypothetical protein
MASRKGDDMETTKVKPEDVAPPEKEKAARKDGPLYGADDVGRISDLLSEYADKLGEDVDRLRALNEKKEKRATRFATLSIATLIFFVVYFFILREGVIVEQLFGFSTRTIFLAITLLIYSFGAGVFFMYFAPFRRTRSERDELRWGIRSNADRLETLVRTASQILEHKEHTAVRELELSLRLGEAEARLRQARVLVGTDDD